MSLFRTIAVYLGLGPDDEYDDGYLYDESAPERSADRPAEREPARGREREPEARPTVVAKATPRSAGSAAHEETSAVSAVRSLRPVPGQPAPAPVARRDQQREPRQEQREPAVAQDAEPAERPSTVGRSKPSALSPQTFADAKVVADEFKQSIPVILNLQGLDRDLVRRLVDFSSGLCYGLDGTMEKIASHVFLLTPQSVKVTAEERRRIEERGFDR